MEDISFGVYPIEPEFFKKNQESDKELFRQSYYRNYLLPLLMKYGGNRISDKVHDFAEDESAFIKMGVKIILQVSGFDRNIKNLFVVRESENKPFDLPGGNIEYGESPLSCAYRELKEETGMNLGDFELLGFKASIYGSAICFVLCLANPYIGVGDFKTENPIGIFNENVSSLTIVGQEKKTDVFSIPPQVHRISGTYFDKLISVEELDRFIYQSHFLELGLMTMSLDSYIRFNIRDNEDEAERLMSFSKNYKSDKRTLEMNLFIVSIGNRYKMAKEKKEEFEMRMMKESRMSLALQIGGLVSGSESDDD